MKLPGFAANILSPGRGLTREDFWQDAAPYEGMLYRAAFQYTGSRFDAEDLVQETYLAAFRSRHQLRDRRKLKSWLFVILRNSFLKRAGRQGTGPDLAYEDGIDYDYLDQLAIFTAYEDAQQRLERKATAEDIHQHLKALPEHYRSVLILYFLEEFSYQEIADMLEIPLGTVMSRLARGKQRLKAALIRQRAHRSSREKVIPLSRKG